MKVNERLIKAQKRLVFIQSLELEPVLRNEIVEHLQQEIANLKEIQRITLYEKIYS